MLQNNNVQLQITSKLAKHFLRGSLNFSINAEERDILTPEVQETFLKATIHLDRFKKYPLNNKFCRMFFKKLISYLERDQEILDEIYVFLCSEMEKTHENNEFCYRHYVLENDYMNHLVTIKESKNMVINGTTGMKTWEAAFMLADWALCNKEKLSNKIVLEIGSGVGFTGVTIAKHCNIQSIILSDCHEEVLSTIKENIRINFPNSHESKRNNLSIFTGHQKSLGVTMLDWNDIGDDVLDEIVPDVIIGADIVYDPSILNALCNVFQTFFNRNVDLKVYIASVIRNVETFETFLETLDAFGLKYEEMNKLEPNYLEWDPKIERRFLKIKYHPSISLLRSTAGHRPLLNDTTPTGPVPFESSSFPPASS